jgi:pimeloyl-ACP methyl ester carboxylesterase
MQKAVGLEHEERGAGEPVLLIHGGGFAGAFVPLMHEAMLADRYRLIRYHRRGFAGSDGFTGPFTIEDQARDAFQLLQYLGVDQAHVVGHSYGGVIATQLALDAPDAIRSLVLLEPAIAGMTPEWATGHIAMFAPLVAVYRSGDVSAAIGRFMRGAEGREWRAGVERAASGGVRQVEDDGATFFEVELPAIERWPFDSAAAQRIDQPLLYLTGGASSPVIERVADYFCSCVPQTERVVIPRATHSLHHRESALVAAEIARFLARHPIS